jgi:Asp/Glu/hydantoin racemase
MGKQIALIHTSPAMIPVFKTLTSELLPKASIFNMVDESLLCDIIREKGCPPATAQRLVGHVLSAERAGAEIILVTCSSMGRAVEASRALCAATVLRIDEPMAEKAVSVGSRIGVIATLPSTMQPTVELIRSKANALEKNVQINSQVVEGAFDAVMSGDGAKHDVLISAVLKDLAKRTDVIVLAQGSMARVVESLSPAERPVPILSSPRSAIEHLASLVIS